MKDKDILNLDSKDLALLHQKLTNEVYQIRDDIIKLLGNLFPIPNTMKGIDHQAFYDKLEWEYKWYVPNKDYNIFIEKRWLQEKIQDEIRSRIQAIKKDPEYRQIYYYCEVLAGSEMTIDNFLDFYNILYQFKQLRLLAHGQQASDILKWLDKNLTTLN